MAITQSIDVVLRDIWKDTLNVNTVAATDNFLDAGGNSLAAMRFVARLDDALGIKVPMYVVLSDTTFAGLATKIAEMTSVRST